MLHPLSLTWNLKIMVSQVVHPRRISLAHGQAQAQLQTESDKCLGAQIKESLEDVTDLCVHK